MPISMSLEYLLLYFPLVISISLVVGGTRYERGDLVLVQAQRTFVWITTFMLVFYAILQFASWMV